jgi:hypothetical protein
LGHWVIGSLGHRVIGSLGHWVIGSLGHWVIESLGHRVIESLGRGWRRHRCLCRRPWRRIHAKQCMRHAPPAARGRNPALRLAHCNANKLTMSFPRKRESTGPPFTLAFASRALTIKWIPAFAGMTDWRVAHPWWIPAFAGMTNWRVAHAGWIPAFAGMTDWRVAQGACVTLNQDLGSEAKFFERSYSQGEALESVGNDTGIVGEAQGGVRAGRRVDGKISRAGE